jgi:mercuric reductase
LTGSERIGLGGRAVALELGQMMARFGVEVLILQRSVRLIPDHEPAVGRAIQDGSVRNQNAMNKMGNEGRVGA